MQRALMLSMVIAASCSRTGAPASALVDLASLDPIRREFDAHQGEPRFIALLSPT